MYPVIKQKEAAGIVEVPENMVIAYVDGSFEKSIGRYAFGCVILTPDGQEIRKSGSGSDSAGVAIRNVARRDAWFHNCSKLGHRKQISSCGKSAMITKVREVGNRCVESQNTSDQQIRSQYAGSRKESKDFFL